jgi:putative endonuclease
MSSARKVLDVGMTNDVRRRVHEHRARRTPGFTRRYNVTRLVYVEHTPSVLAAIVREKQLKGWVRRRKIALIEAENPTWRDLAHDLA